MMDYSNSYCYCYLVNIGCTYIGWARNRLGLRSYP